jgi:hypothetical protein
MHRKHFNQCDASGACVRRKNCDSHIETSFVKKSGHLVQQRH